MPHAVVDGQRPTPSAAATSRPCAQVSMKRAVAMEVALIGGPYHGILVPSGSSRSVCWTARSDPARQRVEDLGAARLRTLVAASASTNPSGSSIACSTSASQAALSVAAATAHSSVQARCATWCATSHPVAGVGAAPALLVERRHQRLEPVALRLEVRQHPRRACR